MIASQRVRWTTTCFEDEFGGESVEEKGERFLSQLMACCQDGDWRIAECRGGVAADAEGKGLLL
jgi:hypothetical protein